MSSAFDLRGRLADFGADAGPRGGAFLDDRGGVGRFQNVMDPGDRPAEEQNSGHDSRRNHAGRGALLLRLEPADGPGPGVRDGKDRFAPRTADRFARRGGRPERERRVAFRTGHPGLRHGPLLSEVRRGIGLGPATFYQEAGRGPGISRGPVSRATRLKEPRPRLVSKSGQTLRFLMCLLPGRLSCRVSCMPIPGNWRNPITASAGQTQIGVPPANLLPSRGELVRVRLEAQRQLLLSGKPRRTPVLVTTGGVIFDEHHMVRAAAEEGKLIDVRVVGISQPPAVELILDLPVR